MNRRAFTLVEMLVVIAILGVLMALLMPALNGVRESARTQCKNNLMQIGRAANAHVTQYGFFPSGGWGYSWLGDADCGTGARQPGSWIYQLLPFMGFDMIHDLGKGQGDLAVNLMTPKYLTYGAQMRSSPIPTFNCPTRRRSIMYPDLAKTQVLNCALNTKLGLNHSDYCANTGSLVPVNGYEFPGPSTITCMVTFPNCTWTQDAFQGDGVVFQAGQVTPGSITDGLSNTFFAGEKWMDLACYYNSALAGDNVSMLQGFSNDTVRWCGAGPGVQGGNGYYPPIQDSYSSYPVNGGPNWASDTGQQWMFGSAHPAGVNFVLCDGSVSLISYQIASSAGGLIAYQYLACRNDGQSYLCDPYLQH